MNDDIKTAILEHPDADVMKISKDVSAQFGKFIAPSMVSRVRGGAARNENVSRARSRASETLDDKVALMEDVGRTLYDRFSDDSLPLKERVEAAKELRMWTKMSIDTAGIHDDEDDKVFVISESWDPSPDAKN